MKPTLRVRYYRGCLSLEEHRDGRWSFRSGNIAQLREGVGQGLFAAFLACFLWADRLQSIWHFHHFDVSELDEESVAMGRNLQTLTWITAGALFEAADAVLELEKEGMAAALPDSSEWGELKGMADRWRTDERLIRARNNLGFHASIKLIGRGVERASKDGSAVLVAQGDDHRRGFSSMRLGQEMLLQGMGWSQREFEEVIGTVVDDSGRFGDLTSQLFTTLLERRGLLQPV